MIEGVKDRLEGIASLFVKTKAALSQGGLPKEFINRFGQHVTVFFSGFDRVRFRATLRPLFCANGPEVYLNYCKVLIKNFKSFAQDLSDRLKKLAYEKFEQLGRGNIYLPSSELSKERLVEGLVAKEQIEEGPIVFLSCVESCLTFRVRGDRQTKGLPLVMESGKCTHLYHYYQHPEVGLMHIRVQSWFPFSVDVCLNGREWLARQMDCAGIGYEKRDNCFVAIRDHTSAQELCLQQLRTDWAARLDELLNLAHPLHAELGKPIGQRYYWTATQTEFATDLCFKDKAPLEAL